MEGQTSKKSRKFGSKRKRSRLGDEELASINEVNLPIQVDATKVEQEAVTRSDDQRAEYGSLLERDMEAGRRTDSMVGALRPAEGGYQSNETRRLIDRDWQEDDRHGNAMHTAGPSASGYRAPWSPMPYGDAREFDGRVGGFMGPGNSYGGRQQYVDKRDLYDGRGRGFHAGGREYEENIRYDPRRFDMRPPVPPEIYAPVVPQTASTTPFLNKGKGPTVDLPPLTDNFRNTDRPDDDQRRPLHLNSDGVPTGSIVKYFHDDIILFVKDMNPIYGWDARTDEAQQRMRDRLMHEYRYYGETTELDDKYLRKEAGAALIKYRFNLTQMVKNDEPKPAGLKQEFWEGLKEKRIADKAAGLSAHKSEIARGRATHNTSKKAMEKIVTIELAKKVGHQPLDNEIRSGLEIAWRVQQEEAASRKRQRVSTAASNIAAELCKGLQKQLDEVQ